MGFQRFGTKEKTLPSHTPYFLLSFLLGKSPLILISGRVCLLSFHSFSFPFPLLLPGSASVFKDVAGPHGNLDTSENPLQDAEVHTACKKVRQSQRGELYYPSILIRVNPELSHTKKPI